MSDEEPISIAEIQLSRSQDRQDSREELCERYANLVYKVAQGIHRHLLSNVLIEDLIAYGQTGLLEAYERFDGDYNVRFATYAYYRIRGEILDACRRAGWGLKSKKHKNYLDFDEQAILNDFLESENLSFDDIRHLQLQPYQDDDHKLLDCINYLNNIVSDTAVVVMLRRNNHEFGHQDPSQAKSIERKQRKTLLLQHVKQLDDNSQKILYLYYYKELSMQQIADEMQVSKSWVCRLHGRAIKQLHKSLSKLADAL